MMTHARLHARLNILIVLVGIAISFAGILLFIASYMVEDLLQSNPSEILNSDYGKNECEYWAAIPTILTGIVLVLAANLKRSPCLKYVSAFCAFIVIVLALGVIVEESAHNALTHTWADGDYCKNTEDLPHLDRSDKRKVCKTLRKVDKWFYVMLFSADIVLVLSLMALFALFADWILFTALPAPHYEQVEMAYTTQAPPPYAGGRVALPVSAVQHQQTWNFQQEQNTVQLHTVF